MQNIKIKVSPHEYLASKLQLQELEFSPGKPQEISLPSGTKVMQLLDYLGLSTKYVGLIVVNQVQAALDTELADGDQIELFPPLSGGEINSG